jgi:hypothetical protein
LIKPNAFQHHVVIWTRVVFVHLMKLCFNHGHTRELDIDKNPRQPARLKIATITILVAPGMSVSEHMYLHP